MTARILATTKKIGIAHISVFTGPKYHSEYIGLQYTRASSTVLETIHGHIPPRETDGGSYICLMSEEVASELSIGWTQADWKMITASNNQSDLRKVAQSRSVKVHGIVIPVPLCVTIICHTQGTMRHTWVTYAPMCEKILHNGSCKITIPAVSWSKQVMFVGTFPRKKMDRFGSSL